MSYEIGYRRPPTNGQFTKGRSGNPKGRPKGSRNFVTLLELELAQKIVVNEGGRRKTVTRMQAMVKRLVAGGLQGDQKALMALVEVLRRTGRFDAPASDAADLVPDNFESILDAYVKARTDGSNA